MIKTAFALSFALSTCMVLPALGAEQFQCPLPSNPNDPAKLEQIRGLLPDVNTMKNIERLNATIATLRRDGVSKSLMIDHLVGELSPIFGDGLTGQAAAVMGWRSVGLAMTSIPSLNVAPRTSFGNWL